MSVVKERRTGAEIDAQRMSEEVFATERNRMERPVMETQ